MSYQEFLKRVLTVLALIVLGLALWRLRSILMLAFLSVVISVSMSIPVNRLQAMEVRRGLAITITLVGVIAAIFLFSLAILPTLVVQMGNLAEDFPDAYDQARSTYSEWYFRQDSFVREVLPSLDDEQINNVFTDVAESVSSVVTGAGGVLATVIGNLVVVIVVAVFLLLDPKDYLRGMIMLTPPQYRERMLEVLVELKSTLVAWLSALTFSISITSLLVYLMLGWVWGLPNSIGLAAFAGLMTIIPNIGSIVPIIPISIFTLADDPAKLPFVLISYLAIQQLESSVLTPSIVRRNMNIPAAMIFIFQLIAAALFGFFGILLAVPLLATLITLVREIYVYDWMGQRGVRVDLEYMQGGALRLITSTPDEEGGVKVTTQTFELVDQNRHLRPEDTLGAHPPPEGR